MAQILLIEPDIKLGDIYKQYLETGGHQVEWRTTAQAALTTIDKHRPDLVLLEIQLSLHNGIEFLYEFRSYKDWHDIPVIVHSQVSPVLKAISPMLWDQLTVSKYLYKPITKLSDLLRSVEATLVPA